MALLEATLMKLECLYKNVSNKYNQFVQRQMRQNKPDELKLVSIGGKIRSEYELMVHREPILLFDVNDGHLVKTACWITEEEYHNHIVHVPDIMFFVGSEMWIFEVDGWIHNVKDRVQVRDERRDECYRKAKLNFHIFNELDILLKQGLEPNRPASASEVFKAMRPKIDEIITNKVNKDQLN